jgi:hypothetical protein
LPPLRPPAGSAVVLQLNTPNPRPPNSATVALPRDACGFQARHDTLQSPLCPPPCPPGATRHPKRLSTPPPLTNKNEGERAVCRPAGFDDDSGGPLLGSRSQHGSGGITAVGAATLRHQVAVRELGPPQQLQIPTRHPGLAPGCVRATPAHPRRPACCSVCDTPPTGWRRRLPRLRVGGVMQHAHTRGHGLPVAGCTPVRDTGGRRGEGRGRRRTAASGEDGGELELRPVCGVRHERGAGGAACVDRRHG